MNAKLLMAAAVFFSIFVIRIDAQRYDRRRSLSAKDLILMKLDSVDQMYISRLRVRERFDARRRVDEIARLVDKLGNELKESERALAERERKLDEREKAIAVREGDQDLNHYKDRDRDHGHDKTDVHISPMDPTKFDQMLGTIERTPFDQDKKKIVKTSAINNYFLIDQVIKLASKFPFDSDKLDMIETLYPRILDLDKNYLLYNCFTFSDSKNKLEKFIEDHAPGR